MKKTLLKQALQFLFASALLLNVSAFAQTPAWAVGAPLNAWIEIPGTSGAGGTQIESYSGWAKLPNGKFAITLAGGHGDGQKNSTAVINMLADAPSWVEVGPESPVHVNDTDYQPDGKPTTSHIYHTVMWVPTLNRLMRVGCLFASGALTMIYPHVDGFDLVTNTWAAAGTYPDIPGGGAGVMYNPVTNKVLVGNKYFDPVTGTNTAITTSGFQYGLPRFPWCWDPVRKQAFGICLGDGQGYTLVAGVVAAKIVDTTATPITIAPSAARDQFVADYPIYCGLEYDPINDWFLLYEGRDLNVGRIYKITPNSTNTWDMEIFTYGSGGVTPIPTVSSGLMNKFSYIPELKGIVMMATKASNLYFMRTGPLVSSVSENKLSPEQVSVFPNPVTKTFHIGLSSTYAGDVFVSINNTLGQTVKQLNFNKPSGYFESIIDLEETEPGVYFLRVQTSNGSAERQLIKLEDK
jgi:hypothetical protein